MRNFLSILGLAGFLSFTGCSSIAHFSDLQKMRKEIFGEPKNIQLIFAGNVEGVKLKYSRSNQGLFSVFSLEAYDSRGKLIERFVDPYWPEVVADGKPDFYSRREGKEFRDYFINRYSGERDPVLLKLRELNNSTLLESRERYSNYLSGIERALEKR
jgi:hypothetical protein